MSIAMGRIHFLRAGAGIAFSLLVAGCASDPPDAEYVSKPQAVFVVRSTDTVDAAVTAAADVDVLDSDRARIAELLQRALKKRQLLNVADAPPQQYQVALEITRYEKGNAFARAMLAGLGQIHLEGRVTVYAADHTQIEQFNMDKSFAWGGIYGGTTTMEDIQESFVEGIANTLTGKTADDVNDKAEKT